MDAEAFYTTNHRREINHAKIESQRKKFADFVRGPPLPAKQSDGVKRELQKSSRLVERRSPKRKARCKTNNHEKRRKPAQQLVRNEQEPVARVVKRIQHFRHSAQSIQASADDPYLAAALPTQYLTSPPLTNTRAPN